MADGHSLVIVEAVNQVCALTRDTKTYSGANLAKAGMAAYEFIRFARRSLGICVGGVHRSPTLGSHRSSLSIHLVIVWGSFSL